MASLPDLPRPDPAEPQPGDTPAPWIVCIGASAGGLDALQRFFDSIGTPTDACFVVLQHLSTEHKSMMVELLSRHTRMPVAPMADGGALEPGQVRLMPPGVVAQFDGERIRLQPRPEHGVSLPIDHFFRSLARHAAARSVGVVLSGSGSDGCEGARELAAAGGCVFAQRPESAAFDSMPRSVLATGVVDRVGTPEELAAWARELVGGQAVRLADNGWVLTADLRPALTRIFECMLARARIDFAEYKLPTVARRLERRMRSVGVGTLEAYAELIESDPDEAQHLRRELLIPVTRFFRDDAAFTALREQVIAPLVAARGAHEPIRVWCAGVATGEEAYTVAMLLQAECEAQNRYPGYKVFATDVEPECIRQAAHGHYELSAMGEVDPAWVDRFFIRGSQGRIGVRPEIRQRVLFAQHNLLGDAPFTRIDIAICRNTLIYFTLDAQERALRRLQYGLREHGTMMLGGSEALGPLAADFEPLDAANKLFRLVRPLRTVLPLGAGGRPTRLGAFAGQRPQVMRVGSASGLIEAAQVQLMRALPASVLLDANRRVLHAWGDTSSWLQLQPGGAVDDITRLLEPMLGAAASLLLRRVLADGQPAGSGPIEVRRDGGTTRAALTAEPLEHGGEGRYLLLRFELLPAPAAPAAGGGATVPLDHVAALEQELAESRAGLQATIEDLEAANEELQATNEELMSSNEELQSTNEELQSVNEELYTVNAEYNAKLDALNAANADLENLALSTGIATLFLGPGLELQRYTAEATALFRLRPVDQGRPITDLTTSLIYPELLADVQAARSGLKIVEREIASTGGGWYLARVVGYRGDGDSAARAVLSFIDVSLVRDARRLQALIDSLPEHVAVLDRAGVIRMVNFAWTRFAQENGDPMLARSGVGASYLAACGGSDDGQQAMRGLRAVLEGTKQRFELTYPCHGPDTQRWFVMNAVRLHGPEPGVVISHFDVTPWALRAEEAQA